MKRLLLTAAATAAFALVFAGAASASTMAGQTRAGSGAIIGNVHVGITNGCTGASGSTTSDASGFFTFGGLLPGCYYGLFPSKAGWTGCNKFFFAPPNGQGLFLTVYLVPPGISCAGFN